MIKQTMNRTLSRGSSAICVTLVTLVVGAVEIKALIAREPESRPPAKMDAVQCVACHSDEKAIAQMRMKESGANYLFNPDGTFKDPRLARNKDGSFKDPQIRAYLAKMHPGVYSSNGKW